MSDTPVRERWIRGVAWFLAISYGLGAPVTALLEYRGQLISERFSLPPTLVDLTCAVQLVSSVGVLVRRVAPWAAAALSVTTLGAIASHFRIGSPATSVAGILYTVVQVWFGWATRSGDRE